MGVTWVAHEGFGTKTPGGHCHTCHLCVTVYRRKREEGGVRDKGRLHAKVASTTGLALPAPPSPHVFISTLKTSCYKLKPRCPLCSPVSLCGERLKQSSYLRLRHHIGHSHRAPEPGNKSHDSVSELRVSSLRDKKLCFRTGGEEEVPNDGS